MKADSWGWGGVVVVREVEGERENTREMSANPRP